RGSPRAPGRRRRWHGCLPAPAGRPPPGARDAMAGSPDLEQLDLEVESGARRDHRWGARIPVAELSRDHELAHAGGAHSGDSLVPSLNRLSTTQEERERPPVITGGVDLVPSGNVPTQCTITVLPGTASG